MKVKYIVAAIGLAVSSHALADISVNADLESFAWTEHSSGDRLLKESGLRLRVGLGVPIVKTGDFAFDYHGSLYTGSVDYDGGTQSGLAVHSTTDYLGMSHEISATYLGFGGTIGPMVALGNDSWNRDLASTSNAVGYEEDYSAWYVRLGAVGTRDKFSWKAGLKWPIDVKEKAKLSQVGFDNDLTLKPKGLTSLYASVSYAFDRSWSASIGYEGTRFGESDPEPVYLGGSLIGYAYQPKSNMDVLYFRVAKRF